MNKPYTISINKQAFARYVISQDWSFKLLVSDMHFHGLKRLPPIETHNKEGFSWIGGTSEKPQLVDAFTLFPLVCVCAGRILRQLGEVEDQRQVLTRHHGAAHSPGAPAPPGVCSPGSSSLPGHAAPSCGGCAGWASGSAAQIASVSWCWSGDTEKSTRINPEQHAKYLLTDKESR